MSNGRRPWQQMLSPLRFLRVKYPGKRALSFWVPVAVGTAAAVFFVFVESANVVRSRGLLDVSSGLLSMLVGFFVASLGLTLTLKMPRLDEVPGANPPTYKGEALTWRGFAQMLTAYLVLATLVTYVLAVVCLVAFPGLPKGAVQAVCRVEVGGIYVGLFTHILSTAVFALFVVSEKIPGLQGDAEDEPPEKDFSQVQPPSGQASPTEAPPAPESDASVEELFSSPQERPEPRRVE